MDFFVEILTKKEFSLRYEEFAEKIKQGAVFIYPTDTIYGVGCNALDQKAVEKIRTLKERVTKPFSIIVPSLQWVRKNCIITAEVEKSFLKLPGSYTIILKLKRNGVVAKNVQGEGKTIGIRYPDHWFSSVVEKLGFPIVTTSANKTGQNFMTSLENLDKDIEMGVYFMIYEGRKEAQPSKIINTVDGTVKER